jgi:hypothetical protein
MFVILMLKYIVKFRRAIDGIDKQLNLLFDRGERILR